MNDFVRERDVHIQEGPYENVNASTINNDTTSNEISIELHSKKEVGLLPLYSKLSKSMKLGLTNDEVVRTLLDHGENLIPFFVEYYNTFNLTLNVAYSRSLWKRLEKLGVIATKRKMLPSFADEFIGVAILMQSQPPRSMLALEENEVPDTTTIETMLLNFGHKRYEELEFLLEDGKVTMDMFKLLNLLMRQVRHRNKKETLDIICFILSFKTLSLDNISYPEISHIKFGKNDIVWYLWKVLLVISKKSKAPLALEYVKNNISIFSLHYQKKYRNQRLRILYFTYLAICKGDLLYIKDEEKFEEKKVDVVIDESHIQRFGQRSKELDKSVNQKNQKNQNNQHTQKNGNKIPLGSSPTNTNANTNGSIDPNLDYLMCFTVIDVDAQASVMKDRNKSRIKNDETHIKDTPIDCIDQNGRH